MKVIEAQKIEGRFKSFAFFDDEKGEEPVIKPEPQPNSPDITSKDSENKSETLGPSDGTCSTGFGILGLAVLGAALMFKRLK